MMPLAVWYQTAIGMAAPSDKVFLINLLMTWNSELVIKSFKGYYLVVVVVIVCVVVVVGATRLAAGTI